MCISKHRVICFENVNSKQYLPYDYKMSICISQTKNRPANALLHLTKEAYHQNYIRKWRRETKLLAIKCLVCVIISLQLLEVWMESIAYDKNQRARGLQSAKKNKIVTNGFDARKSNQMSSFGDIFFETKGRDRERHSINFHMSKVNYWRGDGFHAQAKSFQKYRLKLLFYGL